MFPIRCSVPRRFWCARWKCRRRRTGRLIRRARAAGARVVLNLAPAAPIDPALFAEIDVLVANEGEAAALGADPAAIARRLRQALVVTSGGAGSTAFLADGGRIDTPALAIEPVDTTGAGDTFVGVLAAGLDRRLDARDGIAPGQRRRRPGLPRARRAKRDAGPRRDRGRCFSLAEVSALRRLAASDRPA